MRRATSAGILVCLVGMSCWGTAPVDGAPPERQNWGRDFVTPAADDAIQKGLAFLAASQHEDGSFGSGRQYQRNVAVTGLCGMAFLAAGHTPNRGQYGAQVARAVDFILSRTKENGYIIDENSDSHGPMYGHGFATTFLAEVYGMSRRKDVHDKLEKAVRLIVETQNDKGGWRYYPRPMTADLSVTVCQVMALRAARNAGIYVPKETIDRSTDYVKSSQNADGGFRYQLTRRTESLFPRSAAAIVALYSAGVYEGSVINKGRNFLMRYLPQGQAFRYENHYYYGHYYAVQAMWHAGGKFWRQWYPAIRDELINRQLPDGSWSSQYTNQYATAMACLTLEMPNALLPIFQR